MKTAIVALVAVALISSSGLASAAEPVAGVEAKAKVAEIVAPKTDPDAAKAARMANRKALRTTVKECKKANPTDHAAFKKCIAEKRATPPVDAEKAAK